MKILVVHHNDADGIVSAAVVKYAYQKEDYQNTDFEFKAYGNDGYSNDWDIPALVAGFDKVFVVDFSFPAEKLVEAKQLLGNNFVWIDHHKSALAKAAATGEAFAGIQSAAEAGCMLCWQYFYGVTKKAPLLVETINKFDNWRKDDQWESFTVPLNICVNNFLNYLDGFDISLFENDDTIKDLVSGLGSYLYKYELSMRKHEFRSIRETFVEQGGKNFSVAIINSTIPGSLTIEKWEDSLELYHEVALRYSITPQWTVEASIYTRTTNDFDCSKFASEHGGGGHHNAAGFRCSLEEFRALFR